MSYSFIQTPATMSLAQSPVVFSVSSSTLVGQTNFQYIGELTIWTGSLADSGSGNTWTLAKYPSSQGLTGIFDLSRIINSTQTELIQQNISPIKYFRFDSYYRYQSGSVYFTGSVISSSVFEAADGYQIFPEAIGAEVNTLVVASTVVKATKTDVDMAGGTTNIVDSTGTAFATWALLITFLEDNTGGALIV